MQKGCGRAEQDRIQANPNSVQQDIYNFYHEQGLSETTADKIANELTQNPLATILKVKYDVSLATGWSLVCSISSLFCAVLGGFLPHCHVYGAVGGNLATLAQRSLRLL